MIWTYMRARWSAWGGIRSACASATRSHIAHALASIIRPSVRAAFYLPYLSSVQNYPHPKYLGRGDAAIRSLSERSGHINSGRMLRTTRKRYPVSM